MQPKKLYTVPIALPNPNLCACLIIRQKAFTADLKKFSLVRATYMYAFFVMYFTTFSRTHSKYEVSFSRI